MFSSGSDADLPKLISMARVRVETKAFKKIARWGFVRHGNTLVLTSLCSLNVSNLLQKMEGRDERGGCNV